MQIAQETGEFLFLVMIFAAMGGVPWTLISWSLLTFFTPKKLLNTYFKEPYFTQTELIFMSQFHCLEPLCLVGLSYCLF
jgi:hypothetical protein